MLDVPERLVQNVTIGAVLMLIVWQLPTLIKLFMENRKEVAIEMHDQTKMHVQSLDRILENFDEKHQDLVERFETRFQAVEKTLQDLCKNLAENQQVIINTLRLLRDSDVVKHQLYQKHIVQSPE
jgi:hypothetical protein